MHPSDEIESPFRFSCNSGFHKHIDGTASLGFSNVAPKQFVGRDIPGGPERQPAGATSDTDGARAGGSAKKAVPTRSTRELDYHDHQY